MKDRSGSLLCYDSPIASLISEDAPQLYLKAGLFDTLPPPAHKSFQEEEPKWLKVEH
jgi:hypothetical protein